MELTLKQLTEAIQPMSVSKACHKHIVNSVEFDTRHIVKNSLFVPLKGERDGHDFIDQALTQGASLVLTDRPLAEDIPFLQVRDTLEALQQLAKWYLKQVQPKVVAITGSNGKTTTKDMTAAVMATTYQTYKTQGNYNNHIGLPYTILHMPSDTEVLVLEMGMDHKGEIEVLSLIGEPDLAAITLIGESHIEYLGSRMGIAEAKMEIISGMSSEGILVIPNDEPLLKELIMDIEQTVETFGVDSEATISGSIETMSKTQTTFTTSLFPDVAFTIPVLGSYNVRNALIAVLLGHHLQVEPKKIQSGLATFALTKNRTEWLESKNGLAILSDVYNANPTATRLVLDAFSQLDVSGRKIVILGDMLELGKESSVMHEGLSEHISPEQIDQVFLYGPEMLVLYQSLKPMFGNNISWYDIEQKETLIDNVCQYVTIEDTVFLKGSNGMKLIDVVSKLLEV
ncbi:UDP-N-acetylmuramoyl-tripeptide--D-alanyl-D-alanine ligase [Vagococcus penaei]|uniref:UDP-N-acetylmuramoyl-tripeptide--D-alanyl-D-alanine ligase n=1 Tax=Vagococcus penaei TaxID=633807 RepID=A0A1Q2D6L2_9ENTE|nr:UDP-N-acetylmuramoyl-tripeptide--D-alanyl-D-alanine ligase [Vagococcus penaei]AQP54049.1 UDP-N-acetylmuramoyl-tripeptide--D-alanyl-D-alanine ligase [Vagococcus penaei]RSU01717.1 UDP-N-acetylmuramoyl-tripeptide--D-alanyl-D-alanine ligase [Vagococcus penaei]